MVIIMMPTVRLRSALFPQNNMSGRETEWYHFPEGNIMR